MIAIVIGLVIFIFIAAFFFMLLAYAYNPFKHPLPTESDYTYRNTPWWHLYYASKYLAPVKKAEKTSSLETYFKENCTPIYPDTLLNRELVTIKSVGDLMYRRDLATLGSPQLWDEIGPYLFKSDLTVGNMEFAVNAAHIIEKVVRFSIPPDYAKTFLEASLHGRFDLVFTANNHINDSYSPGIKATCDYLDAIGIKHVGANRQPNEVDNFPIIERKGVRIAFLAYTFSTNGIPLANDFAYGTNLVRFNALHDQDYDPSLIHRHIKLAKKRGADIIVSSHHWGVEFEYYPSARLQKRAHELLEAGIDIIIGHHPHIINPAEWYKTADGRQTLCFYSLGNLTAAGLPLPIQKLSATAEITIETGYNEKGQKITRLLQAGLKPIYFRMKKQKNTIDHRLLPLLDCAEKIKKRTPPLYLNIKEQKTILALEKEYRRYFVQKAFFYS